MSLKLRVLKSDSSVSVVDTSGSGTPPPLITESEHFEWNLSYNLMEQIRAYLYFCVVVNKSSMEEPHEYEKIVVLYQGSFWTQ